MAKFSGNFRGHGPPEPCPLCGSHEDTQQMSFQCPVILGQMEVTEEYENIFEKKISQPLARTLGKILKLRKKKNEWKEWKKDEWSMEGSQQCTFSAAKYIEGYCKLL